MTSATSCGHVRNAAIDVRDVIDQVGNVIVEVRDVIDHVGDVIGAVGNVNAVD